MMGLTFTAPIIGLFAAYGSRVIQIEGTELAAIWVLCFLQFILASLIENRADGLRMGYAHAALYVAWLIIDLPAAISILCLGTVFTYAIRLRFFSLYLRLPILSPTQVFTHIPPTIFFYSFPLLGTAVVYVLLGGQLPLQDVTPNTLPALFAALLCGFVLLSITKNVMQLRFTSAIVASEDQADTNLILRPELWSMPLIALMPIVYYRVGLWGFVVCVVTFSSYTLRYRHALRMRREVVRRVQELSILNNISQTLVSNLSLNELLVSLYDEVSRLIHSTNFHIALFDDETRQINFELVMERGQWVQWPSRWFSGGITEYVLEARKLVVLNALTTDDQWLVKIGIDPTLRDSENIRSYMGIPLMVGEKRMGVMAIVHRENRYMFGEVESELFQTVASQASLALRNAGLYTRTSTLVRNLSDINHAVQDVMFSLNSDIAMKAACEMALRVARADRGAIFVYDEDQNCVRLAHHIGLTPEHVTLSKVIPFREEWRANQYRFSTDVFSEPDSHNIQERALKGQWKAFAQVPMRVGDAFRGLLVVYYKSPYTANSTTLDLLQMIANQVTAAMDNARLFQALEVHAFEMTQLMNLSRVTTLSLQLNEVAAAVCDTLRQMLSTERVVLALYESADDRVRTLGAAAGAGLHTPELGTELTLSDHTELREVLTQAYPRLRTIRISDIGLSPGFAAYMETCGDTILGLIPLLANETVLGVVILGSAVKSMFTEREIQLGEAAANQIATQIQNARLFGITEDSLNLRLQQLSAIEDIALQISSAMDFTTIIGNVLEAAIHTTQADFAGINLLTDASEFWTIQQYHFEGMVHKDVQVYSIDSGVVGQVLRSGTAELVRNNQAHPSYQPPIHEYDLRSSVAVPIIHEHEVIGVLNVESIRLNFFREEHVSFLNNLAGHAAISIENARLMEEREYQIVTLTRLRDLSLRLSEAISAESISVDAAAQAVLETALEVLEGKDATLYFYDDGTDQVSFFASVLADGRRNVDGPDTPSPDGNVIKSARTSKMRSIADVREEDDYEMYKDVIDYIGLLCLPIMNGAHVRAVLAVSFDEKRTFLPRELNTLELLARQAGAHLETASLYATIQSSNDRMRAFLDSTRDGIILLDREGRLVMTNPTAQRMLGIRLSEFIGRNFADTIMDTPRTDEAEQAGYPTDEITTMARVLRQEPHRITRRSFAQRVQNQVLYIDEIGSPVVDDHNTIIGRLLVLRDVTEEKRLAGYRADLTHMLIHDLRSPLNNIISSMELVRRYISEPDEVNNLSRVSEVSANRLLNLVNTLLDISKLESGQMPLNRANISVKELTDAAYLNIVPSVEQAKLNVRFVIPEKLPQLNVDKDQMTRVLINLLDNAVRYTPRGGDIQVAVVYSGGRSIRISVADSGRGIPPDARDRIFEKFIQVEANVPERGSHKGTGLGLTFCKLAVEAHGGQIWVENQGVLKGASIAFTVPVA